MGMHISLHNTYTLEIWVYNKKNLIRICSNSDNKIMGYWDYLTKPKYKKQCVACTGH